MDNTDLANIALYMVRKGYTDGDDIRYCDDLYSATSEEKDVCIDFVGEILDVGLKAFAEQYE